MRFEMYLFAKGNEAAIRSLHQESNIPGASIRPLKTREDAGIGEVLWLWHTPYMEVQKNEVDERILSLFEQLRPFFPKIRQYAQKVGGVCLEVVGFYNEYDINEHPLGLYLSAESISLLNELGCALDYDTVPDTEKQS